MDLKHGGSVESTDAVPVQDSNADTDGWLGTGFRTFWVSLCFLLLAAGLALKWVPWLAEWKDWSSLCIAAFVVLGLMISVADDGGLGGDEFPEP